MTTVAIIQARMNSTRLPGKVMLQLPGGTVLQTVVERVRAAKRVDRVVVATSMNKADAQITSLCWHNGIDCHRGSEADVLDRVYQAAISRGADYVVDITADCPLVDPRHIDRIVGELIGDRRSFKSRSHDDDDLDYVSNCWIREWPDGLDVQAYSIDALEKVWRSQTAAREHVGWNIPQQADKHGFHLRQICAPKKYQHPEIGVTLDEPADYTLLKKLFTEAVLAHGGNNVFPVEWALDYLLDRPEMLAINAGVKRKEPGK